MQSGQNLLPWCNDDTRQCFYRPPRPIFQPAEQARSAPRTDSHSAVSGRKAGDRTLRTRAVGNADAAANVDELELNAQGLAQLCTHKSTRGCKHARIVSLSMYTEHKWRTQLRLPQPRTSVNKPARARARARRTSESVFSRTVTVSSQYLQAAQRSVRIEFISDDIPASFWTSPPINDARGTRLRH